MKKLFILLFLPIGIMAQSEEAKTEKDSTSVTLEVSKEKVAINNEEEQKEQKILTPECISGDCKEGKGTKKYLSGVYEGEWKNGLRDGQGKYTWTNGDTYTGAWFEDKRNGQGLYIWHDGSKYKGNYSHGVRSGYGIYYYTNGTIYEGTWQNNLKHGIANFYYKESVNIGGKYFNNEYVSGTGVTQGEYKYKPSNL